MKPRPIKRGRASRTIFGDEVVLATDLKKRQSYWLGRARELGGVTIVQGKKADLVLASRQRAAEAEETAYYVRMLAPFLREVIGLQHPPAASSVFPWLHELDTAEQDVFVRELVEVFSRCVLTGDWAELDDLLEDWQATAEAYRNPELMEAWRSRGQQESYAPAEAPNASQL